MLSPTIPPSDTGDDKRTPTSLPNGLNSDSDKNAAPNLEQGRRDELHDLVVRVSALKSQKSNDSAPETENVFPMAVPTESTSERYNPSFFGTRLTGPIPRMRRALKEHLKLYEMQESLQKELKN